MPAPSRLPAVDGGVQALPAAAPSVPCVDLAAFSVWGTPLVLLGAVCSENRWERHSQGPQLGLWTKVSPGAGAEPGRLSLG